MMSRRSFGWFLASLCAVGVAIGIAKSGGEKTQAAYTFGDLARDETARCIENGGNGQWDPSLRVTLQNFCAVSGAVTANDEHRRTHRY